MLLEEFMIGVEEKERESRYIYILEFFIYFSGLFSVFFIFIYSSQEFKLLETSKLILLVILAIISQVIALWGAYKRAIRITSCPKCNKYKPFLRREIRRN